MRENTNPYDSKGYGEGKIEESCFFHLVVH